MRCEKTFIPYGVYWSSPFVKWQGSFASQHAFRLAAEIGKARLQERSVDLGCIQALHLGYTVPQKNSFYGAPWMAALMGMDRITGPVLSQACATGARTLASAAMDLEVGDHDVVLAVTADRCSNGPHLYYPDPTGPGGRGQSEDWVWDNFQRDPYAKNAMIETAENVAREAGIDRAVQDELTLVRHQQYQKALADERAFQRRYMVQPVEVKDASGRRVIATVETDEGVFPTTVEGLAKLKPVLPEGTVTFGAQTFPADGNAGVLLATKERALELGTQPITVQVCSFAQARTKKGFMAMAVVPAAREALKRAGIAITDVKATKTHNPFAVNDVYFAREMDLPFDAFNDFGSPLIYGHPQGPTGMRVIVELVEQLALAGGGYGLFSGCAAGDTAMACVVRVDA